MVLGLLDRLQILSQVYLIELPGFSTGLGLLEPWHLIYPKLLTWFGISGQIFGLISSFLEEKSTFKMLGLICSSKLDWSSYIISIAETASKNLSFYSFYEVSFI